MLFSPRDPYLLHNECVPVALQGISAGNGNDQNFQGGYLPKFVGQGGYFGFSAQGGYKPPSGKTGSSAFSVI